jgi:hypothetical protein
MLVKEMRQGLKARTFVAVFNAIQLTMVLSMFVSMLPDGVDESREMGTGLYWAVAVMLVLFIMPLRGLTAFTTEIKERTFDLVLLTRLTPFRIVIGKWSSLLLQTVLVTITLLPYLVLRYFLGGVDLVLEVVLLGLMLTLSGWLAAVSILTSTYQSLIGRAILVAGQFWSMWLAVALLAGSHGAFDGDLQQILEAPLALVLCVVVGVATTLLLLEVAAGRIAPMAENHAVRKRSIAAVLYATSLASLWTSAGQAMTVVACVVLSFVLMDAACEKIATTPSIYAPYVRFRVIGPLFGRFAYPGWPSGVLFSLVIGLAILIQCAVVFDIDSGSAPVLFVLSYFVSLFVPLALERLVRRGPTALYYVGYFIASSILGGLIAAVSSIVTPHESPKLVGFIPAMAFVQAAIEEVPEGLELSLLAINGTLLIWALLTLLVKARAEWRAVAREEQKANAIASSKRADA